MARKKKSKSKKISKSQVVASHVLKPDEANRKANELVAGKTKVASSNKTKSVVVTGIKTANMMKKASFVPTPMGSSNVTVGTTSFFSLDLGTDAFELPRTIRDLHAYYRHFSQNDEIISRALELRTVLPLSKVRLSKPNGSDEERNKKILAFYQDMCDKINLLKVLVDISHEYNLIGNVYIFHEMNDDLDKKIWDRIIILNPDSVEIKTYPFINEIDAELIPDADIKRMVSSPENDKEHKLVKSMPTEIVNAIKNGENIPLDTDKFSGSYVAHIARRKSQYDVIGTSMLQSVLRTLIYREKLRQAQVAIANRNMAPIHLAYFDKPVSPDVVEDLRNQLDIALNSEDYSLVSSSPITIETLGAQDRLLSLSEEYEETEKRLMVGLGFTKEVLTGEGLYSGGQISIEILNTEFLLYREMMQDYVEKNIFLPIAVANDFYEEVDDINGNKVKKYLYPQIMFNRLQIKDSSETFDALYNLYSKGSIPVSYLLDLFNISSEEVKSKLKDDVFTIEDSAFNDFIREVYNSGIAEKFGTHPEIIEKITKALGLKEQPTETPPEEEDGKRW